MFLDVKILDIKEGLYVVNILVSDQKDAANSSVWIGKGVALSAG
jgi:hypothetical protein